MDKEETLAERIKTAIDVWSRRPKTEWLDYESEDLLKEFLKAIDEQK